MSRLTVNASDFCSMLNVLAETAYGKDDIPDYNSVYIAVTQGEYGDEPGVRTLIAGYSMTLGAAGHSFMPADGTLDNAVIGIPLEDVKSIVSIFGKRARKNKENEDYALTLTYDNQEETLEVSEYVAEFDQSAFSLTVTQCPDGHGIVDGIKDALNGKGIKQDVTDADGTPIPEGTVSVYNQQALGTLAAVAKKTKNEIRLYQLGHPMSTILFQSGVEGVMPFCRGYVNPIATNVENTPTIPVM